MTGILAAVSTVIPHLLNFPFDLGGFVVEPHSCPVRFEGLPASQEDARSTKYYINSDLRLRNLMCGHFRGQRELKDCAPTATGSDPQSAAV